MSAQLLWQIIQNGKIYRLIAATTVNGKHVQYIDCKTLKFGVPPKPLSAPYNPIDLMNWLLQNVFNFPLDAASNDDDDIPHKIIVNLYQAYISVRIPEKLATVMKFILNSHTNTKLVDTKTPYATTFYAL